MSSSSNIRGISLHSKFNHPCDGEITISAKKNEMTNRYSVSVSIEPAKPRFPLPAFLSPKTAPQRFTKTLEHIPHKHIEEVVLQIQEQINSILHQQKSLKNAFKAIGDRLNVFKQVKPSQKSNPPAQTPPTVEKTSKAQEIPKVQEAPRIQETPKDTPVALKSGETPSSDIQANDQTKRDQEITLPKDTSSIDVHTSNQPQPQDQSIAADSSPTPTPKEEVRTGTTTFPIIFLREQPSQIDYDSQTTSSGIDTPPTSNETSTNQKNTEFPETETTVDEPIVLPPADLNYQEARKLREELKSLKTQTEDLLSQIDKQRDDFVGHSKLISTISRVKQAALQTLSGLNQGESSETAASVPQLRLQIETLKQQNASLLENIEKLSKLGNKENEFSDEFDRTAATVLKELLRAGFSEEVENAILNAKHKFLESITSEDDFANWHGEFARLLENTIYGMCEKELSDYIQQSSASLKNADKAVTHRSNLPMYKMIANQRQEEWKKLKTIPPFDINLKSIIAHKRLAVQAASVDKQLIELLNYKSQPNKREAAIKAIFAGFVAAGLTGTALYYGAPIVYSGMQSMGTAAKNAVVSYWPGKPAELIKSEDKPAMGQKIPTTLKSTKDKSTTPPSSEESSKGWYESIGDRIQTATMSYIVDPLSSRAGEAQASAYQFIGGMWNQTMTNVLEPLSNGVNTATSAATSQTAQQIAFYGTVGVAGVLTAYYAHKWLYKPPRMNDSYADCFKCALDQISAKAQAHLKTSKLGNKEQLLAKFQSLTGKNALTQQDLHDLIADFTAAIKKEVGDSTQSDDTSKLCDEMAALNASLLAVTEAHNAARKASMNIFIRGIDTTSSSVKTIIEEYVKSVCWGPTTKLSDILSDEARWKKSGEDHPHVKSTLQSLVNAHATFQKTQAQAQQSITNSGNKDGYLNEKFIEKFSKRISLEPHSKDNSFNTAMISAYTQAITTANTELKQSIQSYKARENLRQPIIAKISAHTAELEKYESYVEQMQEQYHVDLQETLDCLTQYKQEAAILNSEISIPQKDDTNSHKTKIEFYKLDVAGLQKKQLDIDNSIQSQKKLLEDIQTLNDQYFDIEYAITAVNKRIQELETQGLHEDAEQLKNLTLPTIEKYQSNDNTLSQSQSASIADISKAVKADENALNKALAEIDQLINKAQERRQNIEREINKFRGEIAASLTKATEISEAYPSIRLDVDFQKASDKVETELSTLPTTDSDPLLKLSAAELASFEPRILKTIENARKSISRINIDDLFKAHQRLKRGYEAVNKRLADLRSRLPKRSRQLIRAAELQAQLDQIMKTPMTTETLRNGSHYDQLAAALADSRNLPSMSLFEQLNAWKLGKWVPLINQLELSEIDQETLRADFFAEKNAKLNKLKSQLDAYHQSITKKRLFNNNSPLPKTIRDMIEGWQKKIDDYKAGLPGSWRKRAIPPHLMNVSQLAIYEKEIAALETEVEQFEKTTRLADIATMHEEFATLFRSVKDLAKNISSKGHYDIASKIRKEAEKYQKNNLTLNNLAEMNDLHAHIKTGISGLKLILKVNANLLDGPPLPALQQLEQLGLDKGKNQWRSDTDELQTKVIQDAKDKLNPFLEKLAQEKELIGNLSKENIIASEWAEKLLKEVDPLIEKFEKYTTKYTVRRGKSSKDEDVALDKLSPSELIEYAKEIDRDVSEVIDGAPNQNYALAKLATLVDLDTALTSYKEQIKQTKDAITLHGAVTDKTKTVQDGIDNLNILLRHIATVEAYLILDLTSKEDLKTAIAFLDSAKKALESAVADINNGKSIRHRTWGDLLALENENPAITFGKGLKDNPIVLRHQRLMTKILRGLDPNSDNNSQLILDVATQAASEAISATSFDIPLADPQAVDAGRKAAEVFNLRPIRGRYTRSDMALLAAGEAGIATATYAKGRALSTEVMIASVAQTTQNAVRLLLTPLLPGSNVQLRDEMLAKMAIQVCTEVLKKIISNNGVNKPVAVNRKDETNTFKAAALAASYQACLPFMVIPKVNITATTLPGTTIADAINNAHASIAPLSVIANKAIQDANAKKNTVTNPITTSAAEAATAAATATIKAIDALRLVTGIMTSTAADPYNITFPVTLVDPIAAAAAAIVAAATAAKNAADNPDDITVADAAANAHIAAEATSGLFTAVVKALNPPAISGEQVRLGEATSAIYKAIDAAANTKFIAASAIAIYQGNLAGIAAWNALAVLNVPLTQSRTIAAATAARMTALQRLSDMAEESSKMLTNKIVADKVIECASSAAKHFVATMNGDEREQIQAAAAAAGAVAALVANKTKKDRNTIAAQAAAYAAVYASKSVANYNKVYDSAYNAAKQAAAMRGAKHDAIAAATAAAAAKAVTALTSGTSTLPIHTGSVLGNLDEVTTWLNNLNNLIKGNTALHFLRKKIDNSLVQIQQLKVVSDHKSSEDLLRYVIHCMRECNKVRIEIDEAVKEANKKSMVANMTITTTIASLSTLKTPIVVNPVDFPNLKWNFLR